MTFNEVRKALGLMPFEEYRNSPKRLAWIKEMQKHNPQEHIAYRATGTTTRMLCQALVCLSELPEGEKVYIESHHPSYTRTLVYMARKYADKLGLDPMAIQHCYYRSGGLGTQPVPNLFTDHYYRLGI